MGRTELFVLVASALAVAALCRRRGLNAPLVLVAVALAVSLVPGLPRLELEPEVLLDLVLPPLLYSAAQAASYRDLRAAVNPIARLGVALVVVTALAVAGVVTLLEPGLPFAAALVLGAVVAPPDAVSAAAVGRRLGLPRRVMTLLSGESLINDATSLTLYSVALAGVATGAWALGDAAGTFALAVVGGVGVGLGLGVVLHAVRMRLDDPVVASAVSLLTPFAAYWSAEAFGGSGVLAVVAAGLHLGHHAPRAGYATRLYQEPLWSTVDLLLESFTFALIGLQLPWVVRDVVASDEGLGHGVVVALATLATAVLVRPLYVVATRRVDHLRLPGSHRPARDALGAREAAVVSWAGMRGVVTLAAATAIPAEIGGEPFPERATLQLAAYTVAIGTLLAQGLTLPWVIRRLRVGAEGEAVADDAQEAAARLAEADAVDAVLDRYRDRWADELGPQRAEEALGRIGRSWRRRTVAAAQILDPEREDDESARPDALGDGTTLPTMTRDHGRRVHALRREIVAAQRAVLVQRRDAGGLDEEVLRRMLRELDLEDEALSSSWVARALVDEGDGGGTSVPDADARRAGGGSPEGPTGRGSQPGDATRP
ncbi:Na+/H+ antiporter [Cellulomonas endophytica]|uniref:Na+/H+ antiporter n=1 Tax=Cellulomonas endophytica TaxID=2494735 RepID=UPI0010118680|nr:Na+/H+ antiporter [Cellulomonas endophytica]